MRGFAGCLSLGKRQGRNPPGIQPQGSCWWRLERKTPATCRCVQSLLPLLAEGGAGPVVHGGAGCKEGSPGMWTLLSLERGHSWGKPGGQPLGTEPQEEGLEEEEQEAEAGPANPLISLLPQQCISGICHNGAVVPHS